MTDRVHPSSETASASLGLASQAERRLLVGALAAEVGHDLQGALNLFRLNVERLTRGEALDAEDLGLLGEELGRLSVIGGRLRELATVPRSKVACTPRQLVDLALGSRPPALGIEIEMPDAVTLLCNPALLSLALRELLDNALEARKARAGVRFEAGNAPGFCVWDDGDGLTLASEAAFTWGVTTRPFAAGLGLTLALRAARAHGFELELRRAPPLTEAWIAIPAAQVTRESST